MQKIAMFGGTFNPIHIGHIETVKKFHAMLDFSRLFMVPTKIPVHKSNEGIVDAYDRLEMCKIATSGLDWIEVSDMEISRSESSYTILTLHEICSNHKDSEIFLIVGSDMFLSLHEWHRFREILDIATVCVAPRHSGEREQIMQYEQDVLRPLNARVVSLYDDIYDISSEQIRDVIKSEISADIYLPDGVFEYIKQKGLYKN